MRTLAAKEAEQMVQAFEKSQLAYARGEHALARIFSDVGKRHKKIQKDLNQRASDWIFAGGW